MVDGSCRIITLRTGLTRGNTCQQSHTLINGFDRHNAEPFLCCSADDVLAQHQVFDVARGNDDTLAPREPRCLTGVEETLDLLIDATDRLDPAELVYRARYSKGLTDRHFRKRRQQGEKLGGRRAVAVDPGIGLLKDKTGVERKRPGAAEPAAEKAAEDKHALGVQRTAELDFALDVDDLAASEPDACGDAGRVAKRETAEGH